MEPQPLSGELQGQAPRMRYRPLPAFPPTPRDLQSLLAKAVDACDADRVHALLAAGQDPNTRIGDLTALHKLTSGGDFSNDRLDARVACIRAFLAAGADPNLAPIRSLDQSGPLSNAVSWGRPAIVRLLLEAGANVNHRASNGETVLFGALHRLRSVQRIDHEECIRELLRHGVDVNAKKIIGHPPRTLKVTVLDLAVLCRRHRLFPLLLRGGADYAHCDGSDPRRFPRRHPFSVTHLLVPYWYLGVL